MSWDAFTSPSGADAWLAAQPVAKVERQVTERRCCNRWYEERHGISLLPELILPCSCGDERCTAALQQHYLDRREHFDAFCLAPFDAHWASMEHTNTPAKLLRYKRTWLVWEAIFWVIHDGWQYLSPEAWDAARKVIMQDPYRAASEDVSWLGSFMRMGDPDVMHRLTATFGHDATHALLSSWAGCTGRNRGRTAATGREAERAPCGA